MIISKNFEIQIVRPVTTEQIEFGLSQLGIDPVRWAIVDVGENSVTVCVSFEEYKQ